MKEPSGPVGILQACTRAPHGCRHCANRVFLTDHADVEPLLHLEELLDLSFESLVTGIRVHLDDDFGDVVLVDLILEQLGSAKYFAKRFSSACARFSAVRASLDT